MLKEPFHSYLLLESDFRGTLFRLLLFAFIPLTMASVQYYSNCYGNPRYRVVDVQRIEGEDIYIEYYSEGTKVGNYVEKGASSVSGKGFYLLEEGNLPAGINLYQMQGLDSLYTKGEALDVSLFKCKRPYWFYFSKGFGLLILLSCALVCLFLLSKVLYTQYYRSKFASKEQRTKGPEDFSAESMIVSVALAFMVSQDWANFDLKSLLAKAIVYGPFSSIAIIASYFLFVYWLLKLFVVLSWLKKGSLQLVLARLVLSCIFLLISWLFYPLGVYDISIDFSFEREFGFHSFVITALVYNLLESAGLWSEFLPKMYKATEFVPDKLADKKIEVPLSTADESVMEQAFLCRTDIRIGIFWTAMLFCIPLVHNSMHRYIVSSESTRFVVAQFMASEASDAHVEYKVKGQREHFRLKGVMNDVEPQLNKYIVIAYDSMLQDNSIRTVLEIYNLPGIDSLFEQGIDVDASHFLGKEDQWRYEQTNDGIRVQFFSWIWLAYYLVCLIYTFWYKRQRKMSIFTGSHSGLRMLEIMYVSACLSFAIAFVDSSLAKDVYWCVVLFLGPASLLILGLCLGILQESAIAMVKREKCKSEWQYRILVAIAMCVTGSTVVLIFDTIFGFCYNYMGFGVDFNLEFGRSYVLLMVLFVSLLRVITGELNFDENQEVVNGGKV